MVGWEQVIQRFSQYTMTQYLDIPFHEDIINPFTLVVRDLSKIMECPFRAVNKPCDRAGMSQMTRITRISQYLYRLIRRHGIEIASHDYRQTRIISSLAPAPMKLLHDEPLSPYDPSAYSRRRISFPYSYLSRSPK